ncbi:hypothetical protein, partial [Lactobacillus nasalidis]
TGGDSSQATLFSLGISPWMSAMIIIGMLAQLRLPLMSKMTERKMDIGQKTLTFFLAVIQASVMLQEFQLTDNSFGARLGAGLFLLTGCFLLIWLSVENDKNGLGGISLILMANMFFTLMKNFVSGLIPGLGATEANIVRAFSLLAILFLGTMTVILTNAERRVPVTKLLISAEFGSESYLPIRLLPAGSMPAMFATTMFVLPKYLLQFLFNLSAWTPFKQLAAAFDFSRLSGLVIYCLILVGLTYGFSYISIDPLQQADDMQQSGDYIPGFHPGKETEKYLRHLINVYSFVSSIYFVLFVGLPMGLTLISSRLSSLVMLPNYVIILAGFGAGIAEQIEVLQIRSQYQGLL